MLIAISRLYLGVHDLQDVLGGLLIGTTILLAFLIIEPDISKKLSSLSIKLQLILAVLIPILLFIPVIVLFPGPENDFGLVCGAMLGVSVGYIIETQHIKLDYALTTIKLVIRAVIGLIIVVGIYILFDLLEPAEVIHVTQVYDFISYLTLGLVGTV